MKGRKPKPTAVKALQGNPGRRPLNKAEPKVDGATTAPRWLDKVGKQEWRRLAPKLQRLGLLTPADRALFAAYCRAYSRLVHADRFLRRQESLVYATPSGSIKPWPQEAIANQAVETMRKIATEFGFTPSSRSRITLEDREASKSKAAAFLFGDSSANDECHADDVN
jgi:P27 family predicted phage terminase small subunit